MSSFRKISFVLALWCLLFFGNYRADAQTPAPRDIPAVIAPAVVYDLKTVGGHVYKSARLARVEPDGITFFYEGGAVKIPFLDLTEEMRRKYGYDPKKAAEFKAADDAAQEAAYRAEQPTIEDLYSRTGQEGHQKPAAPASDEFSGYIAWDELEAAKKRAVIDAKNLVALYDDNELAADNVCKGKVGKIRGTVTDISRDALGVPYLMLDHGVRCAFPRGQEDQLRSLRNGQAVVLIGQIHGKTIGLVSMYKCTLF